MSYNQMRACVWDKLCVGSTVTSTGALACVLDAEFDVMTQLFHA